MSNEIVPHGGQAVLEGVMMRGTDSMAMAVRNPEGEIIVEKYPLQSRRQEYPFLNWPLIRGVVALIEALFLGVKTLSRSANLALGEEEEEIKPLEMVVTVLLSLGLAVLLFVIMPAAVIRLLQGFIKSDFLLNLGEGLIKIAALMAYIGVLNVFPDTRRFFQNHGAEHKVLHTYEAGMDLTVENVRRFSTRHPRCGTSFIFLVVIISAILFTVLFGRPPFLQRILSHLLLLPVVAGIAYEILRAGGKKNPHVLIKIARWPGLLLQALTTREPDGDQIDVAIKALEGVLN